MSYVAYMRSLGSYKHDEETVTAMKRWMQSSKQCIVEQRVEASASAVDVALSIDSLPISQGLEGLSTRLRTW